MFTNFIRMQSKKIISYLQNFKESNLKPFKAAHKWTISLLITALISICPIKQNSGSHLKIHYDDGYLEQILKIDCDSMLSIDYSASTDSTEFKVEFQTPIVK